MSYWTVEITCRIQTGHKVTEAIADHGNADITTLWEKLNESECIDVREKWGGWKKDEGVSKKVMSAKNFTLKEVSEILYDVESAKDKMLKNMTKERKWQFFKVLGKILPPYHKLYDKKASTSQL